jgi:hypothetical protein
MRISKERRLVEGIEMTLINTENRVYDTPYCRYEVSQEAIEQKCTYHDFCTEINESNREKVLCLRCLEKALYDLSWRERAVYRFEPYTENVEKISLSIQYRNPCYGFDFRGSNCAKAIPESVYIPLFTFAKPLMSSLNISQSSEKQQFILQRFTEAKAMSRLFLEESVLISKLTRRFNMEDSRIFLTALMASDGGKRTSIPKERKLYEHFLYELEPYLYQNEFRRFFEKHLWEGSNSLGSYFELIRKNRKNMMEAFNNYSRKFSVQQKNSHSTQTPMDLYGYEMINFLGLLAGTIHQEFVEKSYSAFSYPIHALRDFLYLKSDYGNNPEEALNSCNVIKFLRICMEYESLISEEVNDLLSTMNQLLTEKPQMESMISSPPIVINSCRKRYLELAALAENTNNSFLVLGAVPITTFRELVKTSFSSSMKMAKGNTIEHTVSLASAQSVHVHFETTDSAYYIRDCDSHERFFGRSMDSSKVVHRNTRKYSTTVPSIGNPKGVYENLIPIASTKTITLKYRLSMTLSFYFAMLLLLGVLTLLSRLAELGFFGFVSSSGFIHLPNMFIPRTVSGISMTTIAFISAIIPLLGAIVPLFYLDRWSLAHRLISVWKWSILVVNLGILATIAISLYM